VDGNRYPDDTDEALQRSDQNFFGTGPDFRSGWTRFEPSHSRAAPATPFTPPDPDAVIGTHRRHPPQITGGRIRLYRLFLRLAGKCTDTTRWRCMISRQCSQSRARSTPTDHCDGRHLFIGGAAGEAHSRFGASCLRGNGDTGLVGDDSKTGSARYTQGRK